MQHKHGARFCCAPSSVLPRGSVPSNFMTCVRTTVQLLEMKNLDRGAKDIKFGPLVLTPDVEDHVAAKHATLNLDPLQKCTEHRQAKA